MAYRPVERAKEYFSVAELRNQRMAIAASVVTAAVALIVGVVMASMRLIRARAA